MKTAFFATALMVAASLAAAQPSPPAAAPGSAARTPPLAPVSAIAPIPELELLKPISGNWICDGKVPETALGPAHTTSTSLKTRLDLDNHWLTGVFVEKRTAANPQPLKGKFHWTWDTAAQHFSGLWIDNTGAWGTQTSPGWQAHKLVWTGESAWKGAKVQTRDTFTEPVARAMTHTSEMNLKGQWIVVAEDTCRRGAGAADSPSPAPSGSPTPSPAPKQP